MIRLLSRLRAVFCLFLCFCVIPQGCAKSSKSEPELKIGMHIDAVLEFVVAYPLSWSKDRRLPVGRKQGEVRWTHPDHPHTLLRIKSYVPKQQDLSIEQQIEQVLQEDVGLAVSARETVIIPAGEAWHITGHKAQVDAEIYLLLRADRSYLIELTAPPEEINAYKAVLDRVTHSFQIMPQ